jgi:hypothetical protein
VYQEEQNDDGQGRWISLQHAGAFAGHGGRLGRAAATAPSFSCCCVGLCCALRVLNPVLVSNATQGVLYPTYDAVGVCRQAFKPRRAAGRSVGRAHV